MVAMIIYCKENVLFQRKLLTLHRFLDYYARTVPVRSIVVCAVNALSAMVRIEDKPEGTGTVYTYYKYINN